MADDLFVYFDGVTAFGEVNGAIQIELAANVLDPGEGGGVQIRRVTTAHLRCSPAAAADLAQSVERALEMLKNRPQQAPGSEAIN